MEDAGKNDVTAQDPRGLIREAYRIEGIDDGQCRSIFLDWALGSPADQDHPAVIQILLDHYAPQFPDHPMTAVLQEGVSTIAAPSAARRTGRRRSR